VDLPIKDGNFPVRYVKVYQAGYLKYHVGISGWISSRKRTNKLETRILLIRVMLHDVLGKTSAWIRLEHG
jgi:hypothetical protein